MLNQIRGYSNNGLSTFKGNPRAYYFSHVRRWQSEREAGSGSMPLIFGQAWHSVMDHIWPLMTSNASLIDQDEAFSTFRETWIAEGGQDPFDLDEQDMKSLGVYNPFYTQDMIHEYIFAREKFLSDKELLEIEQPFAVPLDPSDKNLYYTGRMDKVLKDPSGKIYPIDHKTTAKGTREGRSVQPAWIDQWRNNAQILGYMFACYLQYGRVDGAYVDGALIHRHSHDVFPLIPILKDKSFLDYWLWSTRHQVDVIEQHILELEKLRKSRKIYDLSYMPAFPCTGCIFSCKWSDLCATSTNPEKDFPLDMPLPIGFTERSDDNGILEELGLK